VVLWSALAGVDRYCRFALADYAVTGLPDVLARRVVLWLLALLDLDYRFD
jgi:hypothetical protein